MVSLRGKWKVGMLCRVGLGKGVGTAMAGITIRKIKSFISHEMIIQNPIPGLIYSNIV